MKAPKKHRIKKFIRKLINPDILKVIVACIGIIYIMLVNKNPDIPDFLILRFSLVLFVHL